MPFLSQSPQTAIAVSGKATLNCDAGVVTTETLSTAAAGTYTLTLACNAANAKSVVLTNICNGTNTTGDPDMSRVVVGNGVITFAVVNRGAGALNGNLLISFVVFN